MAKQMKRVEKRYVPQQESFRQLPGLRPQAEPQAAVATPAPDSGAERLRELAESLAAGNKALGDFFTMEKSFEETNRVANRTRAMLGLPQAEGPGGGLLDWGSDYGYQEGSGLAQGISLKDKLLQDLDNQNFFIDEANPDPQATMSSMNSYVQKFINDNVGDQQNNPAFMAGVSKYLVEARVEATVTASNRLEALKLQKQLGNYGTWATSMFTQELPKTKTPQDVREVLSRLTAESQRFGISRDAAADHLAATLSSQYESLFTQAHDNDDIEGMDNVLRELQLLSQALDLPDSAGIPFGGVLKDAAGKLQQPLAPTKKELHASIRQMINDREVATKRINDKTVSDKSADLLYRMQSKEINPAQAVVELNELYRSIPSEQYLRLQKFVNEIDRADMDVMERPGLAEELQSNLDSVSLETISKHVANRDLKRETAVALYAEKQRRLSAESTRLSIQNKQLYARDLRTRQELAERKRQKDAMFHQWARKNADKIPLTEVATLKRTWDGDPDGNSMEYLDGLMADQQVVKKERERLKGEAERKKQEVETRNNQMLLDVFQKFPQFERYRTTLKTVLSDPRHATPEGLEFFGHLLDSPRIIAEIKAAKKLPGGGTPEQQDLMRRTEALFFETLNPVQKAELKKRAATPGYEIPYDEIQRYNMQGIAKLERIKKLHTEGTPEFQRAMEAFQYYMQLNHPLASEEAKTDARRLIKLRFNREEP